MVDPPANSSMSCGRGFALTRWSVVISAQADDAPAAAAALEELCRAYWYPLYAFVRREGHPSHEAEDLTQEFFAQLLARDFLHGIDRGKGRFRCFLLASLRHFLANQHDLAKAQKRGGGRKILSLDAATADSRYRVEQADTLTPEKLFERQWALAVLDQVLARLQAEFQAAGKTAIYENLKEALTMGSGAPYAELGARLGMSEGAVKVAVHRLRRRYRELLREEIAQTVAGPDEVEDEIRHLLACLL